MKQARVSENNKTRFMSAWSDVDDSQSSQAQNWTTCDGNEDINFRLIYVETRENVGYFRFLMAANKSSCSKKTTQLSEIRIRFMQKKNLKFDNVFVTCSIHTVDFQCEVIEWRGWWVEFDNSWREFSWYKSAREQMKNEQIFGWRRLEILHDDERLLLINVRICRLNSAILYGE
jgi:hypothetical protein